MLKNSIKSKAFAFSTSKYGKPLSFGINMHQHIT